MPPKDALKNNRGITIKSLGASVVAFGTQNTDLAIRIAVFTAAAHFCLGLLFVAGYQVYYILQTFVRPLMWALLTGTFLFPFKTFLAGFVKSWLQGLKTTSTPILAGIAFTPFRLVDRVLDYVGAEIVDFFRHHGRKLLCVVAGIVSYFLMYFYFVPYLGFVGTTLRYIINVTTAMSTNMIWFIIIPYGVTLHFFWSTGYRKYLLYAAIPLWTLIGFYGYFLLDELAVPVYIFLTLTIALGYSESNATQVQSSASVGDETLKATSRKHSFHLKKKLVIEECGNPTGTALGLPRTESFEPGDLEVNFSEEDSPTSVSGAQANDSLDSPFIRDTNKVNVEKEGKVPAGNKPANIVQSSMFRDHASSMGSMLMNTYQNVAEVLKDERLATHTEQEKADADAIRKQLGVGGETSTGTRYLSYVFWMFFLLEALTSYYLIPLLMFPVSYRVAKIMIRKEGCLHRLSKVLGPFLNHIKLWIADRAEVITPTFIKQLVIYARVGDRKVLSLIESMTDETVSAILILLMFVVAFASGVVAMLQIEQETSYLVSVSGNLFDETFRNNPEYYEWLPEAATYREHFQTAMDSAYIYGRDWAIRTVRSMIADANETRVMEIEKDIIVIADRFYHHYVAQNATVKSSLPIADPNAGLSSLIGRNLGDPLLWFSPDPLHDLLASNSTNATESLWDFYIWDFANMDFLTEINKYMNFALIQSFVKNHIDTFMSVLESVWSILKGNLALIMSLMTTITSVALNYFSAFLNFILCAIIYLTTLFYLLSASGHRYLPVELIVNAGKYYAGAETFATIVEDSISGIFAVSFKIATFYGFYTWVLFSFCGVFVRFIPSVLAATFAVCPLVPSYVVCLPAALNMWLRGDYITMVILCAGSYLPKLFVDSAMYGDLKTANPYFFGLSVAGGIVTLGIEGAVIGPMMLCFLIIVMECYKLLIQSRFLDETVDETQSGNLNESI